MMLPLLRQFAFLSLLLTNSLKPREGKPTAKEADKDNDIRVPRTRRDEFADFMSQTESDKNKNDNNHGDSSEVVKVDITLTAHPIPRLSLVFPFKSYTANILLEIQMGGRVHIVSDNIFSQDTGTTQDGHRRTAEHWAHALETMEDIGAWIEVIKNKLE